MENRYYFCVGAVFKNESHIMEEWLKHYFDHGVDHIFLVNDYSTDHYLSIIEPYIQDGKVTLIHNDIPYYKLRQKDIQNKYFLPLLEKKITKWLTILDLDEFLWSRQRRDLKEVLRMCEKYGQIQFNHTLFGSNGWIEHPKYIVPSFTKRAKYTTEYEECKKYIVNSDFEFESLYVHHADFKNINEEKKREVFIRIDYTGDGENPWFVLHHYRIQSLQFWREVKCTRGDIDEFIQRNDEHFYKYDINEVEDTSLFERNQHLYPSS